MSSLPAKVVAFPAPTPDAHTAALQWCCRALASEIGNDVKPAEIAERAEMLVAIAEHNELPIEQLIEWIHRRVPGKQWSAVEFRGFADKYREAQAQLAVIARAFGVCLSCGAPLGSPVERAAHVCGGKHA